ncbi:MAG: hypothetical protein ACRCYU_23815 [Nocardioides sp.]
MGWLFRESVFWIVLAGLLGAGITWFLTLRKVTVTTVTKTAVSSRVAAPAAASTGVTVPSVATGATEVDASAAEADDTAVADEVAITPPPVDLGSESAGAVGFASSVLPGPYVGSAAAPEDRSQPDGYSIKGNADSMLYHTVESPYYGRTVAEVWFDTEDHARAAGFTRWDERVREPKVAAVAEVPAVSSFGVGSADPLPGGESPHESFTIKGNADSMLYHTVESPYYGRTVAEVWFDTEDHARAAGFTRWDER